VSDKNNLSDRQRFALVALLAQKLKANGSWCGETHLQKASYFLFDRVGSALGYKFILYKHGPYSFDLSRELAEMKASRILDLSIRFRGYGPSFEVTYDGENLINGERENLNQYEEIIDRIAKMFKKKDVRELEKLATALYVSKKQETNNINSISAEIHKLKPHVDVDSASDAAIYIRDNWLEDLKK